MQGVRRRGKSWSYQFSVQVGEERRHISKSGFRTQRDAQTALERARVQWSGGDRRGLVAPSSELTGDYLRRWLDGRRDLKTSTRDSYRRVVEVWLAPAGPDGTYLGPPYLGALPLKNISGDLLMKLYDHLRSEPASAAELARRFIDTGRRPDVERRKALSARSVQYAHTVGQMAFRYAVEEGALAVSPSAAIPKTARPTLAPDRDEMVTWDADEARRFLEAVDDPLWHALFALALDSGMRRGELCGLKWDSVALDAGTVAVVRNRVQVGRRVVESSPKTKRSRRTVQVAPGTVDVLKRWRATQRRARLAAGEAWQGDTPGESGYVFADALGRPLLPDAASGALERWVAHTGVKRIRFHDLRHTSATLDLAAGTHPKVVQEKLGHASVALTLDLYSHAVAGMGADAAASRGRLLYGGGS